MKKNFVLKTRIYSPFDASKNWFVEYYAPHRIRVYDNINTFKTLDKRMKRAKEVEEEIKSTHKGYVSDIEKEMREVLRKKLIKAEDNTISSYNSIANQFFTKLRGQSITADVVTAYFDDLAQWRSAVTHNSNLSLIKTLSKKAGCGYLTEDIERLPEIKTPARYFQKKQITELMSCMKYNHFELYFFCRMMFYTFARPNEIRQQRKANFYFDEQQILFPAKIAKNNKSQFVKISKVFVDEVSDYVDRFDNYIFPSASKNADFLGKNTMGNRFRKVLTECGYSEKSGHSLYSWKHTGVVTAINNGATLKDIQTMCRHASLTETDKYTRQLGVQDLGRFADIMPEI